MNRLQKKCFVLSAIIHSLMLAVLLFGPAFLTSKPKPNDLPVLTIIPGKLIDDALFGGGSSGGGAPVIAPAPPAPQSSPQHTHDDPVVSKPSVTSPPVPTPEPLRKPTVEPEATKPTEKSKPSEKIKSVLEDESAPSEIDKTKPDKTRHEIVPDFTPAQRASREKSVKAAQQETSNRDRASRQAWNGKISDSLQALRGGFSTGTTIETMGSGGEAYANYAQAIKSIYTEAWVTSDDVTDENATVQVKVTINRDGTVVAALTSILKTSGKSSLDKSVREVLDRVRSVPPFPEGAKEAQRTFKLNFNLKAKRIIG